MMNKAPHSEAAFFDKIYSSNPDPWNFEKDGYERERYETILQTLAGRRYEYAIEAGCSIGVLTLGLSPLCDKLLAIDFSEIAVDAAKRRCRHLPDVEVRCMALEAVPSFGRFDLIVLSEIGYYFSEDAWRLLSSRIVSEAKTDTVLLAAHWLGYSKDHEMSGDRVHEIFAATPDLLIEESGRYGEFRLDKWKRR